jgi:hypothetical protein
MGFLLLAVATAIGMSLPANASSDLVNCPAGHGASFEAQAGQRIVLRRWRTVTHEYVRGRTLIGLLVEVSILGRSTYLHGPASSYLKQTSEPIGTPDSPWRNGPSGFPDSFRLHGQGAPVDFHFARCIPIRPASDGLIHCTHLQDAEFRSEAGHVLHVLRWREITHAYVSGLAHFPGHLVEVRLIRMAPAVDGRVTYIHGPARSWFWPSDDETGTPAGPWTGGPGGFLDSFKLRLPTFEIDFTFSRCVPRTVQ